MDGPSVPTTESPAGAWQPLTFGGVAAFAQAPLSRLLLVEFLAALAAAASVVAFVGMAWAPAIQKAISQLPDGGEIRNGQLQWQGPGRLSLVETRFVALGVDLAESGELAPVADVQCLLGPTKAKVTLLFGVFSVAYPSRWIIPLNRTDLDPWWGAWKPAIRHSHRPVSDMGRSRLCLWMGGSAVGRCSRSPDYRPRMPPAGSRGPDAGELMAEHRSGGLWNGSIGTGRIPARRGHPLCHRLDLPGLCTDLVAPQILERKCLGESFSKKIVPGLTPATPTRRVRRSGLSARHPSSAHHLGVPIQAQKRPSDVT